MRPTHDDPDYRFAMDAILSIGTRALTLHAAEGVKQSLQARGLSAAKADHVFNAVLAEVMASELHTTAVVDVDLCTAHMVAVRLNGTHVFLNIATLVLIVGSALKHNNETAHAHTIH